MKKFYMIKNENNRISKLQEDTRVLVELEDSEFMTATIIDEVLVFDSGIKLSLETLSENWNYCIL